MTNGLKAGLGMAALTFILASCGSTGVAPDGSASLRVSDLRTEYRDQAGNYVACDNTANLDGSVTQQTAVATYFTVAGSVSSVNVTLKGVTSTQYDDFYSSTVSGADLANLGGNDYKLTFIANSTSAAYLPESLKTQGIVVNPANQTVYVKTVSTSDRVANGYGAFYSKVTVNTGSSSFSGDTRYLRTIPVYSGCNVLSTTAETL